MNGFHMSVNTTKYGTTVELLAHFDVVKRNQPSAHITALSDVPALMDFGLLMTANV